MQNEQAMLGITRNKAALEVNCVPAGTKCDLKLLFSERGESE